MTSLELKTERLCVLGLGYVGLPTAAIFANNGFNVVGVDVNETLISDIKSGTAPNDPSLSALVQNCLKTGNLVLSEVPDYADVFIIAVPTPLQVAKASEPMKKECSKADLTALVSAAKSVVPYVRPGNMVVLESTVPPKTTVDVLLPIFRDSGLAEDLDMVFCAERVLPGQILEELVNNDRIVGGLNSSSAARAKKMYSSFSNGRIFTTDATTAELVKLMENTSRDVNVALANEFSILADNLGIDVWEAIQLANTHPRTEILTPGPGVGGHCIPVDPWFVAQEFPEDSELIQAARRVNDKMPSRVVEKICTTLRSSIDDPKFDGITVACLGLTYKRDVDDVRGSPAIEIVKLLSEVGLMVRSYDPYVRKGSFTGQVGSLTEALHGANAVVILTDHREFRMLSEDYLSDGGRRLIFDTRNCITLSRDHLECNSD